MSGSSLLTESSACVSRAVQEEAPARKFPVHANVIRWWFARSVHRNVILNTVCVLQSIIMALLVHKVLLLRRASGREEESLVMYGQRIKVGDGHRYQRDIVSVEAVLKARKSRMPAPTPDCMRYLEQDAAILNDTQAEQSLETLLHNKRVIDPGIFDAEVVKLIEMRTVNYMNSKAEAAENSMLFEARDDSKFKENLVSMSKQWREEAKSKRINVLRKDIQLFEQFLKKSESVRKYWNAQLGEGIIQERGIVMSVGGRTALVNAFASITTLRQVGCSLPIAIFYYGDEEFGAATKRYFSNHFEELIFQDLKKSGLPRHHWRLESHLSRRELGYMIKIASMYKSPFRHMLFMDSDAMPLQDPSKLFETESYVRFGNMFFQDFWQDPVALWRLLKIKEDPWAGAHPDITQLPEEERIGLPYQGESGYVLIDKARYWKVLEWLLFLNTQDAVYRFALGDKDTFRLSFYFAGMLDQYNHSPFTPALPLNEVKDWGVEREGDTEQNQLIRFRCLGMLQLHPEDGTALFHHRTADAKFRPGVQQCAFRTPITHTTGPISSQQASIMNFGAPGFSIYKPGDRIVWGLRDSSAWVFPCSSGDPGFQSLTGKSEETRCTSPSEHATRFSLRQDRTVMPGCFCSPERLDDINSRCALLNSTDVLYNPSLIPIVQLPENSHMFQISQMEIRALNLIPFIE